jgi:hypothetical protein
VTIAEWLMRREPRPPVQLTASLTAALGADLDKDATEVASIFLVTAERLLRELVATGDTGREVAGDLLTIDALTTYALESAAETIQTLPAFTDDAMTRFAKLAMPNEEKTS